MSEYENSTFIEEGGEGPSGLPADSVLRVAIAIQAVTCVFGIPGNGLVLYVFGRRGERLAYVVGILALAAKDVISCVVYLPVSIAVEAADFHISSDFLCKTFHLLGNASFLMVVLLLLFLSLERCACTLRGYVQSTYQTRAVVTVVVIVVVSFGLSIVPSLSFGVYERRTLSNVGTNATGSHEIVNSNFCHLNRLIFSFSVLMSYAKFMKLVYTLPMLAILLTYGITFGFVFYKKKMSDPPNLGSPLGWFGSKPVSDTSPAVVPSVESTPSEEATPPEGAAGYQDNADAQEVRLRQEQLSVTILLCATTCVFYVVCLPGILMVFHIIKGPMVLFFAYQLHYATNPFVYLCLEAGFRKEVSGLFHTGWTRLTQ